MEKYKGYDIKIAQDEIAESPREWADDSCMICFHTRYSLGDKHNLSVEEGREFFRNPPKDIYILPLYLYDHSGITISTTPFSCRWDSGQVGYIYISKEKVKEVFNCKKLSKEREKAAYQFLRDEVSAYDSYIGNDVYGCIITKDGEDVDSLWEIYGYDEAMSDAKKYIDNMEEV